MPRELVELDFLQRKEMDPEKEECPKTRNEAEKRIGVGIFSAPSRRPLRTMLSLPEGVEAENVKMQEELAVETKTLKYGQEELAKGLATLFTMEQDMKTKQIKLACDETKLQKRVEEQNQELLTKQNKEKELQNKEKEIQNKEKELQKRTEEQNHNQQLLT